MLSELLRQKISNADYAGMIERNSAAFSAAEHALLAEILQAYAFDVVQEQALAQAVMQQARFDPNAQHTEFEEDEDTAALCPHCLNPPVPPLRDYMEWRRMRG